MTMDPHRTLTVAELGVVGYDAALELQAAMLEARQNGRIGDTLLMMEHPHVFTLGRGADERFIVGNPAGVPVRRVSRGGQVTYHGPGQLIGYLILKLERRDRDVGRYLRGLEAAIIDALANFGIHAARRDAMTGVWVGSRKIASSALDCTRFQRCSISRVTSSMRSSTHGRRVDRSARRGPAKAPRSPFRRRSATQLPTPSASASPICLSLPK